MQFGPNDLFVATNGNDLWNGFLSAPNAEKSDGPLATLDGAKRRVRELRRRLLVHCEVRVWIRGGRYFLNTPVIFDERDSGATLYAAYPGEQPVFDGGMRISGWRETTVNNVDAWAADVRVLITRRRPFKSLFVNGKRRERSRWPKEKWFLMEDAPECKVKTGAWGGCDNFIAREGEFKNWSWLTECEVVVPHYWLLERMPVESFDPSTRLVTCTRRANRELGSDDRYWIENVLDTMTEAGEWFLDRAQGLLYYIPHEDERINETEIVAPMLMQLIRVLGDDGACVHGLRFQGLGFEYCDWEQPDGWETRYDACNPDNRWKSCNAVRHFIEGDAHNSCVKHEKRPASSSQGAHEVPGVIFFRGAHDCAVEDCTLAHIGWYGIELVEGCKRIRIAGNTITDMGAGGVKINGADAEGSAAYLTSNNAITDNHIHDGGKVFMAAIGVLVMHSGNNLIAHNEIHDLFYSGISVGWEWSYKESVARQNRILKNHIYNLGKGILSDLGGIYTLGVQPGTLISGNLIHDIQKSDYGGWGIYPDQASSFLIIENNIVYNTASQCVHEHWGRQNVFRNNIFAFGGEGVIMLSRETDHGWVDWPARGCTVERNIFVCMNNHLYHDPQLYLDAHILTSDLNCFWDYAQAAPVVLNYQPWDIFGDIPQKSYSLEQLRVLGLERHSQTADPLFSDPVQGDFTLRQDSPVFELGFKPIDMSDVGVRPPEKRVLSK